MQRLQRPQPEGTGELDHAGADPDPAELSQCHQPARHRPVRPPAGIILGILEFVGDAQLQKEEESGDKGDQRRRRIQGGFRRAAALNSSSPRD